MSQLKSDTTTNFIYPPIDGEGIPYNPSNTSVVDTTMPGRDSGTGGTTVSPIVDQNFIPNIPTISPIPIAVKDPTYIGTVNEDSMHNISVVCNEAGASVIVNGENTFKTTNTVLSWLLSDILDKTVTNTIEVQKNGFTSDEKYVISVVQNPEYSWATEPTKVGTLPGTEKIYTSVPPHTISVAYYKGGIRMEFDGLIGTAASGTALIIFTMDAAIAPPPEPTPEPTPTPTPEPTPTPTKPWITLTNSVVDRTYNLNTKADVPIGLNKSTDTSTIKAVVNGTPFYFTNFTDIKTVGITIPASVFTSVGSYTVVLTPITSTGVSGDSISLTYNATQEFYYGTPDIFDIIYPSQLVGADYVGADVDFNIYWNSVNTDYIRLYVGTQYIQLSPQGTQKLNVQQCLDQLNLKYSESDTAISIALKMIPYGIQGANIVSGKEELITIRFVKGKYTITRPIAIAAIANAFALQFDTIDIYDEASKYLTHLLHLGDGNNKVITTWTGSADSTILKLYEPLPPAVDVNQLVWISKLQSTPIIETVTLFGTTEPYCSPLKGPNFAIEADESIGQKVFNDLIASGSVTSTDLVNKYTDKLGIDTEKLNIQFISGSNYLFENFVNFGSAEERVNNFVYKIQLIENYQSKYNSISGSSAIDASLNAANLLDSLNAVKRGFDSFENFLYADTGSLLAYPKISGSLLPTTASSAIEWYDQISATASLFDTDNPNYLGRNFPAYVTEDSNHIDFVVFTDMIGQHFDIIWSYITALNRNRKLESKQENGITNDMIFTMLESLGWDAKMAYNSEHLWYHAFGLNRDGTVKYGMSLVSANQEIWRRILNNLPYFFKHKGTARALKAAMACYGVPQSMLTIMEYGGPQDPVTNNVSQFTFEDNTYALHMDSASSVYIPWKQIPTISEYPNCIEARLRPDTIRNCNLISGSAFSLDLIQVVESVVQLGLTVGSSYIASPTFSLSLEDYSHFDINRYVDNTTTASYEVVFGTTNGHRIINEVSMSLTSSKSNWEAGSSVIVAGSNFTGELDEFRLWRAPLEKSKLENHILFPEAINGNSYTASAFDLIFRLDFAHAKDVIIDPLIKNVSISTDYSETYATASSFSSASNYPYQYIPYDRVVTANIPAMGFNYSNKIRFENQELIGDLSYRVRATKKAYDRAPVDSNRLGLFFSPNKELNMDIVKSLGDFNLDNYIGDPADEYNDEYSELSKLRSYYFQRLNRNINEYIQLVRYIDKSLFDVLSDLAPARAKISKGLLIDPHYLERSKVRWDKPVSSKNDYTSSIDTRETFEVASSYNVITTSMDETQIATLDFQLDNYNGLIVSDDTLHIDSTSTYHTSSIDYTQFESIEATMPSYTVEIAIPNGESLVGEVDSIKHTVIGMDANSLANAGFGLYANHGVGKVTTLDTFGNVSSSRQNIYLVHEQYTVQVLTQTAGYPTNGASPGEQVAYEYLPVTKDRYNITLLPFSGSVTVGNAIVDVTVLNGYFPTHYKFVSNLSEGMQRSLFKGSVQTANTTPDGLSPVEIFTTNPNILRVANTGRASGEPVLIVE